MPADPSGSSKQLVMWIGIAFTAMLFTGDMASRYWSANVSHLSETVDHLNAEVGGLASRETVDILNKSINSLSARLDALPQPTQLNSLAARVDQERDDISRLQGTAGNLQIEIDGLQRQAGVPPYPALSVRQPQRP